MQPTENNITKIDTSLVNKLQAELKSLTINTLKLASFIHYGLSHSLVLHKITQHSANLLLAQFHHMLKYHSALFARLKEVSTPPTLVTLCADTAEYKDIKQTINIDLINVSVSINTEFKVSKLTLSVDSGESIPLATYSFKFDKCINNIHRLKSLLAEYATLSIKSYLSAKASLTACDVTRIISVCHDLINHFHNTAEDATATRNRYIAPLHIVSNDISLESLLSCEANIPALLNLDLSVVGHRHKPESITIDTLIGRFTISPLYKTSIEGNANEEAFVADEVSYDYDLVKVYEKAFIRLTWVMLLRKIPNLDLTKDSIKCYEADLDHIVSVLNKSPASTIEFYLDDSKDKSEVWNTIDKYVANLEKSAKTKFVIV